MRDAIFMLAPVALIINFVAYPDQFSAFLNWAGQFLHQLHSRRGRDAPNRARQPIA